MKMNVNARWSVTTGSKSLTLEDIKNNPDKIKDLDEKDLKSFLGQANNWEDYDMVITLAQKLKSKKSQAENVEPDPELQKKLAEGALKQEQENAQKQQEINDLKSSENPEEKDKKIDILKSLLEKMDNKFEVWNKITYENKSWNKIEAEILEKQKDWSFPAEGDVVIKDSGGNVRSMTKSTLENNASFKVIEQKNKINPILKNLIEEIIKSHEEIRLEQSQVLEDLKNAQKTWDPKRINNFKNIIRELERKNKELEAKYKKEEIKYPQEEISRLSTKRIKRRFIKLKTSKTAEGSETTIKRPSLKRNKNIRSRRKLNQVVKSFNEFKNNSDSAVKYILTQERQTRAEHILWGAKIDEAINRWRYDLLHKTWFVMSKAKFEEKFESQKKKIIGNFKENINPSEWSPEDTTIKALEKRMDYYKKSYMDKHYW
jgi:hypothetical protein